MPGGAGHSWFTVTLDTGAPQVTFGAVDGGEAGQLLRIAYTSDEPLDSAYLVRGPRRLALAVQDDRLEAVVPSDWPAGPAALEVLDAVLNARSYADVVVIESPVVALPTVPGGRGAQPGTATPPPRRRERRTLVGRSRAAARSRGVARRQAGASRGRTRVRTHDRVVVGVAGATAAPTADRYAVLASAYGGRSRAPGREGATVTRRDGPDLEVLLLLS